MLKHNIAFNLSLDCPECGSSDVCGDSCGCPACYLPSRLFEDQRDGLVRQYYRFAPVMSALNDARIYWCWSTEDVRGRIVCSLEVPAGLDSWYEVYLHADGYLVGHWQESRGVRETNTAPEPQQIDETFVGTPDEVVNALSSPVPGKE